MQESSETYRKEMGSNGGIVDKDKVSARSWHEQNTLFGLLLDQWRPGVESKSWQSGRVVRQNMAFSCLPIELKPFRHLLKKRQSGISHLIATCRTLHHSVVSSVHSENNCCCVGDGEVEVESEVGVEDPSIFHQKFPTGQAQGTWRDHDLCRLGVLETDR